MTATLEHAVITEPGVYDIPDDWYHLDPVPGGSLSSSGAKRLLTCPALYQWEATHPVHKPQFDIGHAAHKLVLGVGAPILVVDAKDWRTNAAKEAKQAAYAAGEIPVLKDDYATVQAMAEALHAHPIASALFNSDAGKPEQSLFWTDDETGIWRRARLDWLPDSNALGRKLVADYKTCVSAAPAAISKAVHNYRYHQQAAWYLDGIDALGLADTAAFLFVFQEKTAPYLVTVAELDTTAIKIGRDLNRQAMEIYRDCRSSGIWPAYTTDVELISLPVWAERAHLEYYQ